MAWRRAQIPAASGFGNARSVALVQSVMACGGAVGGVRLLSPAGCDRAREEQFSGEDRILGMPVRWGLGYGLFGSSLGWGGWGGSLVMIDPDSRMAVAYVTNQMREPAGDTRGLELVMAAYDGLTGTARLTSRRVPGWAGPAGQRASSPTRSPRSAPGVSTRGEHPGSPEQSG